MLFIDAMIPNIDEVNDIFVGKCEQHPVGVIDGKRPEAFPFSFELMSFQFRMEWIFRKDLNGMLKIGFLPVGKLLVSPLEKAGKVNGREHT